MNSATTDWTGISPLGLLICQPPWKGRSGRDQLDFALAAAALEIELRLFFLNAGVQQLWDDHQPEKAGLPRGLRGWKALPELTCARYFVLESQLGEHRYWVQPEPVSAAQMMRLQQGCARLMVL